MEEILRKNIFIEEDLLKYSPDYKPQDIILRMELRREMVKDSYYHRALRTCYSQKKNLKKKKYCYKMKKEIVKLHAYFQNKNLKNQYLLNNVKSLKGKCYQNKEKHPNVSKLILDILDTEFIKDENVLYDSDSANGPINLVIENNSSFKIIKNEKPIENNYNNEDKNFAQGDDKHLNPECDNKDFCFIKGNKIKVSSPKENIADLQDNGKDYSTCNNDYKNDLQSLLIMLALNSDVDENTEVKNPMAMSESTKTNSIDVNVYNAMSKATKTKSYLTDVVESKDLIQYLNIKHLDVELNYRKKYIIKKYLTKWRLFVNKKRENYAIQQRQEVLNQFFDKLNKRKLNINSNVEPVDKSKILARDYNTYQHRYKVQKHIIALQKAKLVEQNKLIEQLKYNKILESSRQSLDTMREDVRKTYYEIDKHLKPKIKCLTTELKIKELEESSLVLHCLKVPHFLQKMEARAREREEKHAVIRERRKQLEEERIRLKQQAELAKAEMDKEEKIKRIKELREKRKREKIENIRKKQLVERMRALAVMADLHYEKNVMMKYGIRPLRLLLEIKHDNTEKAKAHYTFQLLKNVFFCWMWYTEDMWFERNYKAENFYRKKLLFKTFNAWRENHYKFIIKRQVAEDYYDLYVIQLVFRKFRDGIDIIKKESQIKYNKAVLYYNSNILFKTFICWRTLPALNALKREQDARKLKWRQKVLSVVPDYKPPED